MGWFEQANALGIAGVVPLLGLTLKGRGSFSPCPGCSADSRGNADRRGPAGFKSGSAGWRCHRCGVQGDVADLVSYVKEGAPIKGLSKEQLKSLSGFAESIGIDTSGHTPKRRRLTVANMVDQMMQQGGSGQKPTPRPKRKKASAKPVAQPQPGGFFSWHENLVSEAQSALFSPNGVGVLRYLTQDRKLSEESIKHFKLGAAFKMAGDKVVEEWITIPLLEQGKPVNVRFRSVSGDCLRCGGAGCDQCKEGKVKKQYRVCTGRPLPLYNQDSLPPNKSSQIIITEGELDVIALHTYGFGEGVVSGTSGANAWKDEWLDALEPYAGFLLAYDDDGAGDSGASKLAAKIGRYRCSRVKFPFNDVNECLINGVPSAKIERHLNNPSPLLETKILKVGSFADELELLISNPAELVGRSTGSEKLDKIFGGLRPGLMVMSGETGHGKTSFATWLCLEQARVGVPTMITSFEQRPIGSVQKLLRAQIGGDFMKMDAEKRKKAMGELNDLPLHIVEHRGHMAPAALIESIRYAGRRLDCKVVLVDHIGFVIDPAMDDERKAIEATVRTLSMIGEQEGITIILVAHPNNAASAQGRRVTAADLKGASAIRQDAHEVVIVERLIPTAKYPVPGAKIHLDKVRSEFGVPGSSATLAFDGAACVYADRWGATPAGLRGVVPIVQTKDTGKKPTSRKPKSVPKT